MNVGWSGMSKEACFKRAYAINQGLVQDAIAPIGRCGHVSYSASPGPQARTDFCQCHRRCDTPLEQPAGEEWVTYVPAAALQSSEEVTDLGPASATSHASMSLQARLLTILAVFIPLLAVCLMLLCCWRRRAKDAGGSECEASEHERNEELEQGTFGRGSQGGVVAAVGSSLSSEPQCSETGTSLVIGRVVAMGAKGSKGRLDSLKEGEFGQEGPSPDKTIAACSHDGAVVTGVPVDRGCALAADRA